MLINIIMSFSHSSDMNGGDLIYTGNLYHPQKDCIVTGFTIEGFKNNVDETKIYELIDSIRIEYCGIPLLHFTGITLYCLNKTIRNTVNVTLLDNKLEISINIQRWISILPAYIEPNNFRVLVRFTEKINTPKITFYYQKNPLQKDKGYRAIQPDIVSHTVNNKYNNRIQIDLYHLKRFANYLIIFIKCAKCQGDCCCPNKISYCRLSMDGQKRFEHNGYDLNTILPHLYIENYNFTEFPKNFYVYPFVYPGLNFFSIRHAELTIEVEDINEDDEIWILSEENNILMYENNYIGMMLS